jgi:cytoskeletal protein RodZ
MSDVPDRPDSERREEFRERAQLKARRRRKGRAIDIVLVGFSVLGGLLAWGTVRATCPTLEEVRADIDRQAAAQRQEHTEERREDYMEQVICRLLDIEEEELRAVRGR